ncbi:MAG: hypothetical protein V1693_00280 [Nanoarchaeota archaeon]
MKIKTESIDEIDWFDPSAVRIDELAHFNKIDKMREDSGYKSNLF